MTGAIIILILTLLSFGLQGLISKKKSKWLGLIIPVAFFTAASIFLALNLTDAFSTVQGYGLFLAEYGGTGLFALILKIGFLYAPVIIQLMIYFVCRRHYDRMNHPAKSNREFKRMIAEDLD